MQYLLSGDPAFTSRLLCSVLAADMGHKLVTARERAVNLLLHVAFGLANPDSVISGKLLEQPNSPTSAMSIKEKVVRTGRHVIALGTAIQKN